MVDFVKKKNLTSKSLASSYPQKAYLSTACAKKLSGLKFVQNVLEAYQSINCKCFSGHPQIENTPFLSVF